MHNQINAHTIANKTVSDLLGKFQANLYFLLPEKAFKETFNQTLATTHIEHTHELPYVTTADIEIPELNMFIVATMRQLSEESLSGTIKISNTYETDDTQYETITVEEKFDLTSDEYSLD